MSWTLVAVAAAVSYVLGAVPIGWLLLRLARGIDIRRVGSGNIGTVNVMRAGGPWLAAVVLVLDAAKGFLPVTTMLALGAEPWVAALCGFAGAAGHSWSIFLGFRGGKAVATTLGAFAAAMPEAAAVAVVLWAVVVALTRYASLGSILGSASLPVTAAVAGGGAAWVVLGLGLAALVILRHRTNLQRLLRGEELRITDRVG